eukprot:198736_1
MAEEKEYLYESEDDQYQESIVTGNDARRKVDVFQPKQDDIYECIGQLDVEFDYTNTHQWRSTMIGTGTVVLVDVFDKNSKNKTAMILTCAHNLRCNVIHCTNCNTYRLKKHRHCKGCNNEIRVDNDQKETIVPATKITFRDRSIKHANYGETVENYPCEEIYVPNKRYLNNPKPKDGYDWAFVKTLDKKGVYDERLKYINIDLVNGIETFSKNKQKREYAIFGYPFDRCNKMVGMKSNEQTRFTIMQNEFTKQYYLHQVAIDTYSGQSGSLVWYKNKNTNKICVCGIHVGGSRAKNPYNIATLIDKRILDKWEHIKNNRTMPEPKEQDDVNQVIKRIGCKHIDISMDWDKKSDDNKESDSTYIVQLKEKNGYSFIDRQIIIRLKGNKRHTIDCLQQNTIYFLRIKRGINENESSDFWSDAIFLRFKTKSYVDYFEK